MKIIVGHANMDLDCIGSITLAKYLYPDHVPVKSHLVHPVARKLMNLYEDRLGFSTAADLRGERIERVVVVDTRSMDRIAEYLRHVDDTLSIDFEVYDHHPAEVRDIPRARVHERAFGANTTQLGLELMRQGVFVEPEDATIALTGIYADTGNFTHSNVTKEDFEVASFLLTQGASLGLVKDFLSPLQEKQQLELFHEILNRLERTRVRGHEVHSCYLELDEDSLGLGAVVERVFEVENGEVLLGFFYFPRKGKLLVIGRNADERVNLGELLAGFGGGGHRQAASATIKAEDGPAAVARVRAYLEAMLEPAATAADIMTTDVAVIAQEATLLEASMYLEKVWHTGAPVVNSEGRMVGFLSLRDISKGRKAGQMHVPVRQFMARAVVSGRPDMSVREIDEAFFEHDVGHLPILEGGRLAGLVTRRDLLDYKRDDRRRKEALLGGLAPRDPAIETIQAAAAGEPVGAGGGNDG